MNRAGRVLGGVVGRVRGEAARRARPGLRDWTTARLNAETGGSTYGHTSKARNLPIRGSGPSQRVRSVLGGSPLRSLSAPTKRTHT